MYLRPRMLTSMTHMGASLAMRRSIEHTTHGSVNVFPVTSTHRKHAGDLRHRPGGMGRPTTNYGVQHSLLSSRVGANPFPLGPRFLRAGGRSGYAAGRSSIVKGARHGPLQEQRA